MAELNPLDGQLNGGGTAEGTVGPLSKRQRRPSVRLGDIGGDASLGYEHLHHHHGRGLSKQHQQHFQWRQHHAPGKGSKGKTNETLALTLVESNKGGNDNENEGGVNEGDLDLDRVAIGSWKSFRDASKTKRGRGGSIRKRVRSNWVSSEIDENEKLLMSGGEGDADGEGEEDFNLDNDDRMNRNFVPEEEEEEERNGSPIHSFKNNDVDWNRERGGGNAGGLKFENKNRRRVTRVSDEMESPSDSVERNGVKVWLNQLGLGRYAPVFEIHEVDDEVLPMLTLEDLKDMGVNAVGSRRKMYCSIQKLNRGFS